MKKLKLLIGAALAVALLTVGWAGLASAHDFRTGANVTLGTDQKIQSTLFAAGNTVDIASEVFGDVFCAGQTVTVSGIVHGDVICAGQSVVITGTVDGDVRAAGQTVNLGAKVSGNASIGSQSFTLTSDGRVAGDLSLGTGTATLNGPIGRDLAVGGDSVIVGSQVGRNINGAMTSLQLTSGAKVGGDIAFMSDKEVDRAAGATVGGKITREDLPEQAKTDTRGAAFAGFIYWFLAMLMIAFVTALVFPHLLQRVSDQAVRRPGQAVFVGFVATIAVPVIAMMVFLTIFGIPLALLMLLIWLVVMCISWIFAAYYLGRLILKDSRRPLLIMLAGATLVIIAQAIPLLGILVFLLGLWFGSGMLLLELFNRTPRPTYTLPEAEAKAKS
jgi:hypothetical protein